jgi:hypothetical protein
MELVMSASGCGRKHPSHRGEEWLVKDRETVRIVWPIHTCVATKRGIATSMPALYFPQTGAGANSHNLHVLSDLEQNEQVDPQES